MNKKTKEEMEVEEEIEGDLLSYCWETIPSEVRVEMGVMADLMVSWEKHFSYDLRVRVKDNAITLCSAGDGCRYKSIYINPKHIDDAVIHLHKKYLKKSFGEVSNDDIAKNIIRSMFSMYVHSINTQVIDDNIKVIASSQLKINEKTVKTDTLEWQALKQLDCDLDNYHIGIPGE